MIMFPRKFRESQQEYFGKKGISQHVDVIYMKKTTIFINMFFLPFCKNVTKTWHKHCQ